MIGNPSRPAVVAEGPSLRSPARRYSEYRPSSEALGDSGIVRFELSSLSYASVKSMRPFDLAMSKANR